MTVRQATPDIMGDVLGKAPRIERVAVKAIKVDGGTQMRAALNPETVGEYADAMTEGWGGFPPVVLYYDGSDYWLADGFHRVAAIKVAKDAWIDDLVVPADVRAGSRRDAVLHAAGANASHGLRRTNQDKRRSVEVLLRDPEWAKWSDGEIARRCAVSDRFVASLRKELTPNRSESTTRTGADGRTYNVSNIGTNQPQYVSVWDLQRRVDEFARANGWLARELRTAARNQRNDENYVLLGAAITVDYRRADLVQAINNVANQWEYQEAQQRRAAEWQVAHLPADIAASGYQIHWNPGQGWRVLDPDGGHVQQTGLNSLSECANLIRRLAPLVPAGRPMMEIIRTDEELAAEADAADIASRNAAADEAARQAAAASTYGAGIVVPELAAEWQQLKSQWELDPTGQTAPRKVVRDWIVVANHLRNWLSRRHQDFTSEDADYSIRQMLGYWMEGKWPAVLEEFTATLPEGWTQDALDDAIREVHAEYAAKMNPWATAVAASGSRQHRAELLAEAIMPWILEYRDEYGRTFSTLVRDGNPSHSNSMFWRDITAEFRHRGLAVDNDILKFAIKRVFGEPAALASSNADGKTLVDWTDDDWEAARQAAAAATADAASMAAVLTPDATPVSQRPDYDSDEWYTPAEFIEAARTVMGAIDLDPATCELAQTVVQADVYLTKVENGLGQRWIRERVWLNPPYGQAEPWVAKLLAEFDAGACVRQAIVLLNNMTETGYFQSLLTRFPVCFPNRRIPFWRHDQQGLTGRQGQALFYLGPNVEQFVAVFGAFGPVLRRVE